MISFRNVTYSYRQSGEPKSLDSVHLEVKDGECVLLCGKSGCGKTTMTRLLNGMIPNLYEGKLQGAVLLDGKNLFDLPMYEIAKRVGSVFQNPRTQFYTVNTTSEIAFGCENFGMDPEEISARVRRAAKDLEIESLLDRNIFNLSGAKNSSSPLPAFMPCRRRSMSWTSRRPTWICRRLKECARSYPFSNGRAKRS